MSESHQQKESKISTVLAIFIDARCVIDKYFVGNDDKNPGIDNGDLSD